MDREVRLECRASKAAPLGRFPQAVNVHPPVFRSSGVVPANQGRPGKPDLPAMPVQCAWKSRDSKVALNLFIALRYRFACPVSAETCRPTNKVRGQRQSG